eukprot:2543940-Amphidinium_carterae.1
MHSALGLLAPPLRSTDMTLSVHLLQEQGSYKVIRDNGARRLWRETHMHNREVVQILPMAMHFLAKNVLRGSLNLVKSRCHCKAIDIGLMHCEFALVDCVGVQILQLLQYFTDLANSVASLP